MLVTVIIEAAQCVTNQLDQYVKSVKPIIFIPSLNFNSFSTTMVFMTNTAED